jgi:hypothetical protein
MAINIETGELEFEDIDVGANPNDGTGDSLHEAGIKINDNFDSLYQLLVELNLSSIDTALFVRTNDPRLYDERLSKHDSGRHEENYYAYRNGERFQDFRANTFRVTKALARYENDSRLKYLLSDEYTGNFESLYNSQEISYLLNYSANDKGIALVLGENKGEGVNNSLVDLIVSDDTSSSENAVYKSIFRVERNGSLYLRNKLLVNSNGEVVTSALRQVRGDNVPLDSDTLKELSDKIEEANFGGSANQAFFYKHSQTSPSKKWIVNHELDSSSFILYEVRDENGGIHNPMNTVMIDSNITEIDFTYDISGHATFVFSKK